MPSPLRPLHDYEPGIDPDRLYEASDVMQVARIGKRKLYELWEAGLLPAYEEGRHTYYEGKDLIDVIKRNPKQHKRKAS